MPETHKKNGSEVAPENRLLMQAILEQYIADKVLRPATIASYQRILRLLESGTGIRYLDEMTHDRLRAWKNLVIQRASPTTWNGYHRTIRAILNYCVARGLLQENPLRTIRQSSRGNSRGRCCSQEEIQQVVSFLHGDDHPLASFLLSLLQTLYYTGMRRSQLCGLDWGDLDFTDDTILLQKQHSKTGMQWSIPMHEALRDILLNLRDDLSGRLGRAMGDADPVFWVQLVKDGYRGDRMTPDQLSGLMKILSRRSGVRISSHPIRHLVASTLVNQQSSSEKGVLPLSLTAVRDFLGHSDIKTTVGYVEPSLPAQRALIRGLRTFGAGGGARGKP